MSTEKIKDLSSINKLDMEEIKQELFIRKKELMNMRIYGTLKTDQTALIKKHSLLKDCQKITAMLETLKKSSQGQVKIDKKVK